VPSPGLPTLFVAAHLTAWARRWLPSLLLVAGAALEVVALVLPGVWLGWIGAAVLLLPLLAGRPPQADTAAADREPSEIHRQPGQV
jgi:hypothetical protein